MTIPDRPMAARKESDMYGTVLVALDGSHIAAEALPHAVAVARRCNARIVLLHVLPPARPSPYRVADGQPSRESQAQRGQLEAYFAGLKRSLEHYGVQVDWQIEEGPVAETIAGTAGNLDRPLVIMAEIGKSAVQHPSAAEGMGKVAQEVGKLWDGPLSLVKPHRQTL